MLRGRQRSHIAELGERTFRWFDLTSMYFMSDDSFHSVQTSGRPRSYISREIQHKWKESEVIYVFDVRIRNELS